MSSATATELIYLVAVAHVFARGTIFKRLRDVPGWEMCQGHDCQACRVIAFWRALAGCPLCSGFWIGVLGHFVYLVAPSVIILLGIGSVVGTCALAVCALIRKI